MNVDQNPHMPSLTPSLTRSRRACLVAALGASLPLALRAQTATRAPRLVTISPTHLDERADATLDDVVAAAVRFQDEDALVPDLDAVERRLQTAIAA